MTDSNKRFIQFSGGEEFEVDQSPASFGILNIYEHHVHPSRWWSWGGSKRKKKEEKRSNTKLDIDSIQWLIGRPILHQYFGDKIVYPANLEILIRAWKKARVACIQRYTFPDFDCEDFAFYGMGIWHKTIETARMATYIIWVSYGNKAHALNACCTAEAFYLIDPQDTTYTPFRLPKQYKIQFLVG